MRARNLLTVTAAVTALIISVASLSAAAAAPGAAASTGASPGPLGPVRPAGCAHQAPGRVSCFAQFRPVRDSQVFGPATRTRAATLPPGLSPADLASAYKLSGAGGARKSVAIVDAFDDPNAESDLAVYRQTYGLPPCTTANGCFHKLNQDGAAGPYPVADTVGWSEELSLDLDMVSAACPRCSIVLVEANDDTIAALDTAEDTAAATGALAVSNSFGLTEHTGMAIDAKHYRHPGTSIVASSGDSGYVPVSFPAVLATTIAVGGTALTKAPTTSRGWTERAWTGAGSGCSAYIAKPSWQHDKHCNMRTVSDVSAVADPNTGVAVYDTYQIDGNENGWLVFGGTSVGSPLIAAMIVRSGHQLNNARHIYTHTVSLFDPIGGSTGYCGGDYLCTGKKGYDGPTGAGSPNGLGAL